MAELQDFQIIFKNRIEFKAGSISRFQFNQWLVY